MKKTAVISDVSSDGSFTYYVENALTITVDCGVITYVDIESPLSVNELKNHLDSVRNRLATVIRTF